MAGPMVLHTFVRWAFIVIVCPIYFASVLPSVAMTSTLAVGGACIEVVTAPSSPSLALDELVWVKTAAESVRIYYGVFPISPVSIHITPFRGRGIRNGMAFGTEKGGRITIRVGSETSTSEFASDWTLVHEMVHLAFPSVAEEHHWIEEGIATYVEPIARVRAGQLAPERMWADLVRDMPQGLPQKGDRGLDRTHTWGRTYWGGAIFSFLADLEIRRQTKNTRGLEHALRAILQAGGNIRSNWDLKEALQVGDRATGTRVLEKLYEEMRDKPVHVDLDVLWTELGVYSEGQRVRIDERARFAAIRRAITGDSRSVPAGVGKFPEK